MNKLFGVLILFLFTGCGYTFQGSGSVLPADVKKIYIPMVDNNTTESTLTQLLTEALRDQFDRYGAVTVVEESATADAVLNVKILQLKRGTSTATAKTDLALQQDTVVTIGAELRRVTGSILWREAQISVSQSYGTTSGSVLTSSAGFAGGSISASDLANLNTREVSRTQEQDILTVMSETIARKIYERSVAPDF